MKRNVFLEKGKVYTHKGGGQYVCDEAFGVTAIMRNVDSNWRCTVHGVTMYDDGTIEWDYSTGGYFAEITN